MIIRDNNGEGSQEVDVEEHDEKKENEGGSMLKFNIRNHVNTPKQMRNN